ncbi:MAG: hypothetical protein KJO29_12260 [Bacteroidia bacterium]|nr:hypothetical protein [Bacteroidia bacterium]
MDFNFYTILSKGFFNRTYEVYKDDTLRFRIRKASWFSLNKFIIEDQNGLEMLQIIRPMAFLKIKFRIRKFDEILAEVEREISLTKNNLVIYSKYGDYFVSGKFSRKDFTILKGSDEVAKVSRKDKFPLRNYGIAIKDTEDELFMVGIAFTLELMIRILKARTRQ